MAHLHHAIRISPVLYVVAQTARADLDALAALAAGPRGSDHQHDVWLAGGRVVGADVGQIIEALDQRPELEEREVAVVIRDRTMNGATGGAYRGSLRELAMRLLAQPGALYRGLEQLSVEQVIASA